MGCGVGMRRPSVVDTMENLRAAQALERIGGLSGEGAMDLRRFLGLKQVNARGLRWPNHGYKESKFRGAEALERFIKYDDVKTVLDIGSGAGRHARYMLEAGKEVTTLSLIPPADVLSDYLSYQAPQPFEGIWASHVLEHQPNVNLFLRKCFADLKPNGVLAVSVPPLKHGIVGGHLTLWSPGLLLYNLIIAGFDCAHARVGSYDYDISVIVRKAPADLPDNLHFDRGDIEKLGQFFPVPVVAGFDGRLPDIRW